MNHILEKLNVLFLIEVFAISFSVVALYVLVANSIVYLLVRKRTNEMVREVMKRFLFKFPFKAMGYTFAAGLVGYIGITLTDALLDGNITASTPALDTRPRIVLILFALFGFCFGILVGLALFFKAYKVLSSQISNDAGK